MMKKAILTLAAGGMILAGCSSGNVDKLQAEVAALKEELAALKTQPGIADSHPGNHPSSSTDDSSDGTTGHANQNMYKYGEPFVFEGVTYTISGGERKSRLSDRITADEGYEFIVYHVDIHNTSSEDYRYSQSYFHIVTSEGEIKDNYLILDLDGYLTSGELASGGKKSGLVAFKIPKGDEPQEFRYEVKSLTKQTSFRVQLN